MQFEYSSLEVNHHFLNVSQNGKATQVPIPLRLIINYSCKSMSDFKSKSNNNSLKIMGRKNRNRKFLKTNLRRYIAMSFDYL